MTVLQKSKTEPVGNAQDNSEISFDEFYKRFHLDSVFQMEHVLFPLKGLPANADSAAIAGGTFEWKVEDWKLHRPFDTEDQMYQIELQAITPDLFQEIIFHKLSGYAITRRFARVNNDWYLIYYSGMNPVE